MVYLCWISCQNVKLVHFLVQLEMWLEREEMGRSGGRREEALGSSHLPGGERAREGDKIGRKIDGCYKERGMMEIRRKKSENNHEGTA